MATAADVVTAALLYACALFLSRPKPVLAAWHAGEPRGSFPSYIILPHHTLLYYIAYPIALLALSACHSARKDPAHFSAPVQSSAFYLDPVSLDGGG